METSTITPNVVSREEWLTARKELLAKEKEFTRWRDELSAERRKLPMVKIDQPYTFDGPDGPTTLRELFGKSRQLITYHFMFDPAWEQGCSGCSYVMDNIGGSLLHLGVRDTAFTAVSRAPLTKIEPFKQRMGWTFPWVSSAGNTFNADFHVTLDPDRADYQYNYVSANELLQKGRDRAPKGEMPGLSVFLREGDEIYHTYSTYQRGLDLPMNTYNLLDMTKLGRQEEAGQGMRWVRHHDRY
jgi:predicted dithiol-disulfide oxidoreductase (DUF899 family)